MMDFIQFLEGFDYTSLAMGVTFFFCVLLSAWFYYGNMCKFKMPPGPWGLPVVGYLPFLGKQLQETLCRLRKKYGDVFSMQRGSFPTVVVNGKRLIRDVLLNSAGVFDSRPGFYSFNKKEDRLAFGEYSEKWIVLKTIVVDKFHMLLTKENYMNELLGDEISKFCMEIRKHNGQPFDPQSDNCVTCSSLISRIVYGKNVDVRTDTDFKGMLTKQRTFHDFVSVSNTIDFMPWLNKRFHFIVKPFHDVDSYFTQIRKKQSQIIELVLHGIVQET